MSLNRSNQCYCNQSYYSGKDNRLSAWLSHTVWSPVIAGMLLKRRKKDAHEMTKENP